MIESPLIQELLDQRTKQVGVRNLLKFLTARFGDLPEDLVQTVNAIQDARKLDLLIECAGKCVDLDSFRQEV